MGRRHNGKFSSTLKKLGFSSLNPVYRFAPTKDGQTATVEDYTQVARITGTVTTPLGTVQLVAVHAYPSDQMWLFEGGIRGEGNSNTAVRLLLSVQQDTTFGYIQKVHPREGIDPEGDTTFK